MAIKNPKKHILFQILLSLLLFAFLVCAFTWFIVAVPGWYDILIEKIRLPEQIGMSLETCKENFRVLVDYNMFFGAKVLRLPDFTMSEGGAIHFEDVRRILVTMQYIAIGSGIALIPALLFAKVLKCFRFLKWTALGIIEMALIIFGLTIIDWEGFFTLFHKIAFTNLFWEFTVEADPVILILPDEVFITGAVLILSLLLLSAGGMLFGYYKLDKRAYLKDLKAE